MTLFMKMKYHSKGDYSCKSQYCRTLVLLHIKECAMSYNIQDFAKLQKQLAHNVKQILVAHLKHNKMHVNENDIKVNFTTHKGA